MVDFGLGLFNNLKVNNCGSEMLNNYVFTYLKMPATTMFINLK